ncbi:hypothetical protein JYT22_01145 [Endomicrobium sp. AH-315-J14]|nr:hypothetical protein [Endomicrobium sp. AH-315-J14]
MRYAYIRLTSATGGFTGELDSSRTLRRITRINVNYTAQQQLSVPLFQRFMETGHYGANAALLRQEMHQRQRLPPTCSEVTRD